MGIALSKAAPLPTIELPKAYHDIITPDRVVKRFSLRGNEPVDIEFDDLKAFVERQYPGARAYNYATTTQVYLDGYLSQQPEFKTKPSRACLTFRKGLQVPPDLVLDYNITKENIEGFLGGELLSSEQKLQVLHARKNWMKIGHEQKFNHIGFITAHIPLTQEECYQHIDLIDEEISGLVRKVFLEILQQAPSHQHLTLFDITWKWQSFEISQDVHVPQGVAHYQPMIGWVAHHLTFKTDAPMTNTQYDGGSAPLLSKFWSNKRMKAWRDRILESEGFRSMKSYSSFYKNYVHTMYFFRGTNERVTDLEAMFCVYPQVKGRDGVIRNICRLEFRPRRKSFKENGYLYALRKAKPSALLEAHVPLYLPPMPSSWKTVVSNLLSLLTEELLQALKFGRGQIIALMKGRATVVSEKKFLTLSPGLFKRVGSDSSQKLVEEKKGSTKKAQVRLDSVVLAQLFAEKQVSRALHVIGDFKNLDKQRLELAATVELLIAQKGKKKEVTLSALRKAQPTLGWSDLSSASTRKYQRYIQHWKAVLPERVSQLEDILRTVLHT